MAPVQWSDPSPFIVAAAVRRAILLGMPHMLMAGLLVVPFGTVLAQVLVTAGGSASATGPAEAGVSVGVMRGADAARTEQPLIADLIVKNARVYTVDRARPRASALAVRNGRILALGGDLSRYKGPGTREMDARGATIVPGFIDSHGHMASLGQGLETVDLRDAATAQEAVRRVAAAAGGRPKGEWVLGRGWDQTRWPEKEFPDADLLSDAVPDHPVYLTRVDGHAAWVNRKALESAGVDCSTKDPPGGRIHRNAEGWPTGILVDRAMGLVSRHIPPPGRERIKERLARAAEACARVGLTSVHDAGVAAEELAAYRELIAEQRLPVRIYAMIRGEGELWREYLDRGPEIGPFLTVRSIKLVADGALGSRGAALLEPYSDEPDHSGLLILTREDIERVAREAVSKGFQVNTHAIGDRANRVVLEAYGAVLGGGNPHRFRIEHAQIVSPPDIALFGKYGVIASMQATHATSDMRWAEQRVGHRRLAGAYAWKNFLRAGVRVANGSDFPVEEANPLAGFYASITRQDAQGQPRGGWMPEQRMTRQEALESWTLAGAWAAFEENEKGSLTPGKLADFVMLSQDILRVPPRRILETKVLMTIVNGRIVHDARP